jgi:hypothetical protein
MSNQRLQFATGREQALSKEEIFDVLQNQRRRYVLHYLERFDEPVTLSDLATQVAAWEYRTPVEDVTEKQKKRVYTTLQQTHLPKMDEVGIVDYDSDAGTIERTPHTDELTVYLEIVPGQEFPWREYYLSLGAISLAIVATLWGDIQPFTDVSPLVWATLMAVVWTVSAAYHTFVARELTLSEYEPPDESEG